MMRGRSNKPHVPSAPLARAVMTLASKAGVGPVCARAGIPQRVLLRWRRGEMGGLVDMDLADQVMTRLDLCWWEVWTVDTVREPLFVVTTYAPYVKKCPDGLYRLRRLKDRTIPYGDLGTDFWELRRIGALMVGELEAVAA